MCVLCLRVQRPPFVIFERYSNGTISEYKGYCYEIIHALKSMYNFTYAKSIQQRQSANFGQSVEFFFGIQIRSWLARGQRLWKRIAKWQLEWHDWYDRRSGRNDPFITLIIDLRFWVGIIFHFVTDCWCWRRTIFCHAFPWPSGRLFRGILRRSRRYTDPTTCGR